MTGLAFAGNAIVTVAIAVLMNVGFGEASNVYCSNMNPQSHVDIEQLMGMWYGIEIISHKADAKHEILYEDGCPVLYFSEDKSPTTLPPLYKNYNHHQRYGSTYGRGYQDRTYESTTDDETYLHPTQSTPYDFNYDRNREYDTYQDYQNKRYGVDEYNRRRKYKYSEIRRLRLLWDEKGSYTEYSMRYNTSEAGFWISSGPQNGSYLEPKFNDFAGTIQVMKAVGNHMVLVFCHQMPDRQLYSVLLSRVQNLSKQEIHGVHNLLNRRGLSTTSIRKVCLSNGIKKLPLNSAVMMSAMLLLFGLMSR